MSHRVIQFLGLALVGMLAGGCASVEGLSSNRANAGDRSNPLAHGGVCPEAVTVVNHHIWGPFGFYTHPYMLTCDMAWFTERSRSGEP